MKRTIFICILTAASLRGSNSVYTVNLNTSGLNGVTGDLVFDFISGGGPEQNAISIAGFSSDGTLGMAATTGMVTGTLPSTVILVDDPVNSVFNEYLTGFTFGSTMSFVLDASENAPGAGSAPDEFSAYFLATDGMTPLITTGDPTSADSLFTLDLDGSANGVPTVYSVSEPSGVGASVTLGSGSTTTSNVPEPAIWPVLAALGFLGVLRSVPMGRCRKYSDESILKAELQRQLQRPGAAGLKDRRQPAAWTARA
jgi:hypothetical protein